MKILLIVPEYPPFNIGGGGEVFKELADNLSKLGNELHVIYGYYPNKSIFPKIKLYTENNIKFIQVPEIPCPSYFPFLKTVLPVFPWTYYQLKNIIEEINPEIANIHGYGLFFISQAALILSNKKIPYIYTLHGAPVSPSKMKGIIGLVYYIYKILLGNKTLQNSSAITAVSKFTKKFPEFKRFKSKIQVITNGIRFNDFNSLKFTERKFLNKFFEIDPNELIFFSMGRIEWLKGFQLFIEVIPFLKKDGIKLKYCIGGKDNGYKSELLSRISELGIESEVVFLDFLNFDEKCECYYYSNFIVVPSIVENFPAIPLEAMSMNKIVIGNNTGGIPEIVENNYNGLLVNMENTHELYLCIKELIVNEKLKNKIYSNLSSVSQFNWHDISKKYQKVLKEHAKLKN